MNDRNHTGKGFMKPVRHIQRNLLLWGMLLTILALSGCAFKGNDLEIGILTPEETYEKAVTADFQVVDAENLYSDTETVVTVYLAVGLGNEADGTDHTWHEINTVPLEEQGDKPYQCEAVLQLGDENAPTEGSFGYGQLTANSVVRLQGVNASRRQQKSYRVTIKDGMGSLDGMKSLVFSKAFTDPLRITNKLCYQLMEGIPGMLSTRTRLAHPYVKDTTAEGNGLYADYGLYTMVERINTTHFRNRNLDEAGAISKAHQFDFGRHEDAITLATSAGYRQEAFEALLEVKGNQDHSRLLAMLDAVNDPDIPIRQVVETYFDHDNLYYWLAFNILTGNRAASTENYYLYSPTGSSRFYFISWDNDGAFRDAYNEMREPGQSPGWDTGVFSFYENVLFFRMLQDPDCISALSSAVDTLYESYLTESRVSSAVEKLTGLAENYIYSLPDRTFARVTREQYGILASEVYSQITEHYYAYYDSLLQPAPFHIHEPQKKGSGSLLLSWDAAVCTQDVTYNIQVDDSWDFETPLYSDDGRGDTEWEIDRLPAGQYFLKVTAVSENGMGQIAYETYSTEVKTTVYGVLCFYVMQDGSVHASYFDGGE